MESNSAKPFPQISKESPPPPIPVVKNTSKSYPRILFLMLTFIFLLIASLGGFLFLERLDREKHRKDYLASLPFVWPSSSPNYFQYSPRPFPSPTPIVYAYASTLDVPPLFPKLSWQEVKKEDSVINKNTMLYVDSDDDNFVGVGAILDGKEWYAEKNNLIEEEFSDLISNFMQYSSNKLLSMGWDGTIKVPGYRLQAITADGPTGSRWGFVGAKDDRFRIIIFDEERWRSKNGDWVNSGECPCSLEYSVFVTPELTLEEILAKVEK